MRRMMIVFGLLVFAFTAMPAAGADPPETVPYDPGFEYLIEDCGFPILFTGLTKGFIRTFDDREGVFVEHSNGSGRVVFTNLVTQESIHRNTSGPGLYEEFPDGTWTYTLPGPTAFWDFDDPSLPALFINQGRWQFQGEGDEFLSYTHVGRIEDICAALS